jgi:hypothetical protein
MRPILLAVAACAAAFLAAGCGARGGPAYYVGTDGTAVALITWSAPHTGRASGSITDDTLSGSAPSETVDVQTTPVAVRVSGRDVSFTGGPIDALIGTRITGTLSGGTLRITAPGASGYLDSAVLRPATRAVYEADLAKLRERASHSDTAARRARRTARQHDAAQVTTDEQQVATDVTTLQTDAGALSTDVSQMQTDMQQTSTDLSQLQSDAASGPGANCENVATVDADASTVDSDGTTVGDDATVVTGDISTVQSDITQLTSDLAALYKAGGSAASDPNPQTVISQAQTAMSTGLAQANSYIGTVNGYLKQAYTTASSLSTGSCGTPG